MNLFQSTENKKFDSSQVPMNKCDLLVISICYRDTGNCCFALAFNPRLSAIEEFDLVHNYCTKSRVHAPDSILNFIKDTTNDIKIYSPDSVINWIMQATNPKLVQVTL